ncbi:TPA: hypothetical protein ACGGRC_004962, partial [Escherichia coli]
MATRTVIPNDIKTLKSDVAQIKTDIQGIANSTETTNDWSATWYQQVLPSTGAIFGRKLRSVHKTAGVEDAYCE